MTDLKSIPAVNINSGGLSLHDVLHSLHVSGRLRAVLTNAVTDKIVLEGAQKEGLSVSDEELQKAGNQFRIRARLFKTEDTERWLKANRLSEVDFESNLERTILRRKLFGKVANKEAVEKHFIENRNRFDRVQLSRIVVKDEGLANELLTQIREEGADFDKLLQEHSVDVRSKQFGPRLVARKRLPANIEPAVIAAKDGDVVGPIRVNDAWQLLKVHQHRRGELTSRIAVVIARTLFRRWLKQRMQQAKIEVKLTEYLDQRETGTADQSK